jgi:hypothetical protein
MAMKIMVRLPEEDVIGGGPEEGDSASAEGSLALLLVTRARSATNTSVVANRRRRPSIETDVKAAAR